MTVLVLTLFCIAAAVAILGFLASDAELETVFGGALATVSIYIMNLAAWVMLTTLEDVFAYVLRFEFSSNDTAEALQVILLFFLPPLLPSAIFLWLFGKKYLHWGRQ